MHIYQTFLETNYIDDKSIMGYMDHILRYAVDAKSYRFIKYIMKTKPWKCKGTVYDGCLSLINCYWLIDRFEKLIQYCVKHGATDRLEFRRVKGQWDAKDHNPGRTLRKTKSNSLIKYLASKIKYNSKRLSKKLRELPEITDDLDCYLFLIEKGGIPSAEMYKGIVKYGRFAAYKHFIHKRHVLSLQEILTIAATSGQLDLIKQITNGLFYLDLYGPHMLCASVQGGAILVLNYLWDLGIKGNLNELLLLACENDQFRIAEILIKKGADVAYSNNKPLTLAIKSGEDTISNTSRLLIRHGANVLDHLDPHSMSCGYYDYALQWAQLKYPQYIEGLLEKGEHFDP